MATRDKGITEAEKDQQRKLETLNTNLDNASTKLNGTFAELVSNVAETNKEMALELAEKRLETRDTFSGFLARKKLDAHTKEYMADNADSEKARADLKAKLLNDEKLEIGRNKSLNAMKDKVFSKQFSIDNNITMGIEDRLKKQSEIDEIQEAVDAKETEIKKFRSKQLEKISKEEEQAKEDYTAMLDEASKSEDFDKFSGSVKSLTRGLIDIGGMLDDVVKFGEDVKNVGKGIQSAFGKVSELSGKLGDKMAGPLDTLKDTVMGLIGSIGALWLTMKTKMKEMVGNIGKKATDMKDNVTKKFGDGKAFVADKVTEGKDKVTEGFTKGKDAMMDSVSKLGNNMKMGAKSMGGKGLKAIKAAPAQLMKGARMFVSLLARIPMMLAAIPALLSSPIVLIGLAVLALIIGLVIIWMKFKDQIKEKFEMMKTKVIGVVTDLVEGFLEVWQKVKDWFSSKAFRIRKFLGLTTDEENAEFEKKQGEKKQKKEAMNSKEEEIDAQMKEKFGDKALNFFGGSDEAKEEKKRLMEEADSDFDENKKLDDTSSKDLLEDRDNDIEMAAGFADQLDARKKEVERRMSDPNDQTAIQNGKVLEGDAKRVFLEDLADKGKLVRDEIFVASNKQLENYFDQKYSDSDKKQAELETREDFIPINFANQGRIKELREIDGEGDLDGPGLTEKERMELSRLERDQGDRIKDSADRAKEMGPKRESVQSTAVAQQNTNNNVTNNTISASPNPRPTDNTISRTANVNQN